MIELWRRRGDTLRRCVLCSVMLAALVGCVAVTDALKNATLVMR